jgi:hypothetical protein
MRRIALKLGASIATMPLSLLLVGLTQDGFFFLFFLASLPLVVLYWIDLGRELRSTQRSGIFIRTLGIAIGVPQALFGIVCAGIGLSVVAWVLYNTFVERQPQYSGGFLTLGIGPALILFGVGWLRSAFRSESTPDEA